MKAINLRKYDISWPCISRSKIIALCGTGDRVDEEELMDENIGDF